MAAGTWRNWAGNQTCEPDAVVRPTTEAELRAAVTGARRVKAVGAGHSFTDIAVTAGTQLVLDRYDRILDVDRERNLVTVEAGVTLAALGRRLAELGLAMENLGDIAYQTVSGAISTGTHGTGARFGGIATQVAALTLVLADGSVVRCSADEEPELFAAARVGLGALGVISTVTLQCVPAFNLHAVEKARRLEDVLERLDELVDGNDHYEFFWIPHTTYALTKANNRTDEPERPRGRWQMVRDKVLLENVAFGALCRVGKLRPDLIPRLNTALPGSGRQEYVERSDRVFASPRWVHFYEMEYAVPRASAPDVLRRLQAFVDDSGLKIGFPVEVRFTAPDDIWLSTASGRESCYVAVHVYRGMPYEQYFRGVEAIMDSVGGRPHWGKLHFQTAATLAAKYPRHADFVALRDRLDPDRRFANAYLDRVLGP